MLATILFGFIGLAWGGARRRRDRRSLCVAWISRPSPQRSLTSICGDSSRHLGGTASDRGNVTISRILAVGHHRTVQRVQRLGHAGLLPGVQEARDGPC